MKNICLILIVLGLDFGCNVILCCSRDAWEGIGNAYFRHWYVVQIVGHFKIITNSNGLKTFMNLFNNQFFSSKNFWVWGALLLDAKGLGSWYTSLSLQELHKHLSKELVVDWYIEILPEIHDDVV